MVLPFSLELKCLYVWVIVMCTHWSPTDIPIVIVVEQEEDSTSVIVVLLEYGTAVRCADFIVLNCCVRLLLHFGLVVGFCNLVFFGHAGDREDEQAYQKYTGKDVELFHV